MIGAVRTYINTIMLFLILSVFAQMILPDHTFRKWVQFVLGIMLILLVFSPLAKGSFEQNIFLPQEKVFSYFGETQHYEKEGRQAFLTIYEEELTREITGLLAEEGIFDGEVQIKFSPDTEEVEEIQIETGQRIDGAVKEKISHMAAIETEAIFVEEK